MNKQMISGFKSTGLGMDKRAGVFFGATLALGSLVLGGLVPNSAHAFERDSHYWRHESRWQQGHWTHDRHGGRLGWWWVVGPTWNFYPRPFLYPGYAPRTIIVEQAPPQPAPQTVIVQSPPVQAPQAMTPPATQVIAQTPTLYYCRDTGTYYPDTMTCPGGWSQAQAGVPPTP